MRVLGQANRYINHANNLNHICFIQKNDSSYLSKKVQLKKKSMYLNLLDQNTDLIPRPFTITTNNGSYHFNTYFLKDTSSVISNFLEANPDATEYHLCIKDEENIMKKLEDLYQDKKVIFNLNEIIGIRKITELLDITNCPTFMQPETSQPPYYSIPVKAEVQINKITIINFIKNNIPKTFVIVINNKEFNCNIYGVNSSKIIRELREKDPELNRFVYETDLDNEDDFQPICDFFNFSNIQITINNMDSLKKIAEDLQITFILDDINEFISLYESTVQLLDDKKVIIDEIDELFDWLYHIKELSIETVKDSLLESFWVHSEENIQELVACIFQVVRTSYQLQNYLIDLLLLLDQSANESNDLHLLIPFTIKIFKCIFYKNQFYCAFAFKLTQRNIITFNELLSCISLNQKIKNQQQQQQQIIPDKIEPRQLFNLFVWFLPELTESNTISLDFLYDFADDRMLSIIYNYYPNNIDNYKKMRESGEPDNLIAKAIINDDIDTLQSIISKSKIDINDDSIPLNIFDVFMLIESDLKTSFINYAAQHGSIKCFKYLLLNHAEIDELTLGYAVYGGNTEIIRTVDQNFHEDSMIEISFQGVLEQNMEENAIVHFGVDYLVNPIIPAIMMHHNDLFDWILEQKFTSKGFTGNDLYELAIFAVRMGNAHALIEAIDKGLDLSTFQTQLEQDLIYPAAKEGFYRLLQLIFSLIEKKCKEIMYLTIQSDCASYFGNISIFKLFCDKFEKFDLEFPLFIAIERDFNNIIHFIIDRGYIPPSRTNFISLLSSAASKKNADLFNYLKSKFNFEFIMSNFDFSLIDFIRILSVACGSANHEIVKEITEFILEKDPKTDFTDSFIQASRSYQEEICQYFLDKKVYINLYRFVSNSSNLVKVSLKMAVYLIDKADPEIKEALADSFLNEAIQNGSTDLVEFLFNKNPPKDKVLFDAVSSNDIETVNIVLKYNSKPSFINQISPTGTALNIAVMNNNLPIVKRLLSIPEIDPNLYEKENSTPIISAVSNLNIEMVNVLLDYYGDEIQSQMWQVNDALKKILRKLSNNNENKNENKFSMNAPIPKMNQQKSSFLTENQSKILAVINRLMQIKNIDLNCHVNRYTLLTYACETNEIDLVKMLIKSDKVNVNSYAPTDGNTPLMIAIENKNIEIAHLLIEYPRTNINFRNYKKNTALVIAVINQLESIINLLVNNEKFDPVESCLDYAFYLSEDQITTQLLSVKGLDVNYKVKFYQEFQFGTGGFGMGARNQLSNQRKIEIQNLCLYETTLIHAVNENKAEKVDKIINHPSFDLFKSQVKSAIFVAVNNDQLEIFEKLLKLLNNDVNLISLNGRSLLNFSIIKEKVEITESILANETFDSNKSDLFTTFANIAFLNLTNQQMQAISCTGMGRPIRNSQRAFIDEMEELYTFDQNHLKLIDFSSLLPNGKSFYTAISTNIQNVVDLVQFFLDHNADPNMPDKRGVYPLEFALTQESFGFVSTLLNSNRINISQKLNGKLKYHLKNETYIHLAARCDDSSILNEFINRNLIDVNSTDDLGETPLMKACSIKKTKNIIRLFQVENLDYRKVNIEGKDALKIVQINSEKMQNKSKRKSDFINIPNIQPPEKKAYLLSILNIITSNY